MTDIAAITAFIEAQISEDAKTATGLQSMVTSLSELNDRLPPASRRSTHVYNAGLWALGRVLAEIETKRAILRLHMTSYAELDDGTRRYFCQDRATDPDFNGDLWAPCLTARLVAAPYAGRDGWDEKWALT